MPVKCGMEHVCTSPLQDGFDISFCNTILMVRTNPTEGYLLQLWFTVGAECCLGKHTIIRMVVLYCDAFVMCKAFEGMFAVQSICRGGWQLQKIEYFTACMVNKQCFTGISTLFSAKWCVHATRNRWDLMVGRDAVTRSNMAMFQGGQNWPVQLTMKLLRVVWGEVLDRRRALSVRFGTHTCNTFQTIKVMCSAFRTAWQERPRVERDVFIILILNPFPDTH